MAKVYRLVSIGELILYCPRMELFEIKILCGIVLWVMSLVSGVLLPYLYWRLSSKRNHFCRLQDGENSVDQESGMQDMMSHNEHSTIHNACFRYVSFIKAKLIGRNTSSYVYCLCGGVFLGVSILDLIPDSREAVAKAMAILNHNTDYPITEFMIAVGLLLVMVVENVVFSCMKNYDQARSDHQHGAEVLPSMNNADRNVTTYRMYILVLTLSVHSTFEGLAIGLQDNLSTLYQLAIVVAVHKAVITFGVGLPLFETLGRIGKLGVAVVCAMIFCTASPVGCVIAAFISEQNFDSSAGAAIACAVLQCLATGTFLYVTFLEVIPKEFSNHSHGDHMHQPIPEAMNTYANVTDLPPLSVVSSERNPTETPQLLKLFALLIGFSIAAALQFM